MKHSLKILVVAGSLLAGAVPAAAAVTYSYTNPNPQSSTFVYVAPGFIAGAVVIPASALSSCTTGVGTCGAISFFSDATSFNAPGFSAIGVERLFSGGTSGSFFNYFSGLALQTPGTYQELIVGNGSTLTVTGAPDGVPEPAAWALLVIGFGLVGGVLRRCTAVVAA